jgi:glycosyltransferase involved in cell wall biosynthesis
MTEILEIPPYVPPVKKTEARKPLKSADKKAEKKKDAFLPKVSVIIPAYNVANYIAETMDSVLSQTYKNIEILVINDGSPDTENFEQAIAPYFGKILYLKQPNKGAAAARNTGIKAAQGEILAFLDGDDIWQADYLEEQVGFLHSSGNEMVYCDARLFGEENAGGTYMQRSPSQGEVTTESLLTGDCNVITSGTIALREKILACGGFDPEAPARIEDFDLWFRLLKNGAKIGYQKNVLLKYRVRAEGLSGNSVSRAERTVIALNEIKKKHDLTEDEKRAWQMQFDRAENFLAVERGKAALVESEFKEALKYFSSVSKKGKTLKLRVVTILLKVSPKLARWVFRNFRADEALALSSGNK